MVLGVIPLIDGIARNRVCAPELLRVHQMLTDHPFRLLLGGDACPQRIESRHRFDFNVLARPHVAVIKKPSSSFHRSCSTASRVRCAAALNAITSLVLPLALAIFSAAR
jgi:hypothetical protein